MLDKLSAATSAARKKGSNRHQQQQHPLELPPGLQRIEPEIAAVMDWQDAAAVEQREQQVLLADDADAGKPYTHDCDQVGCQAHRTLKTLLHEHGCK